VCSTSGREGRADWGPAARSVLLSLLARPVRVERSVWVVLLPVPARPRRREGFMKGIAGVDDGSFW
jgi:hypothetical protein